MSYRSARQTVGVSRSVRPRAGDRATASLTRKIGVVLAVASITDRADVRRYGDVMPGSSGSRSLVSILSEQVFVEG